MLLSINMPDKLIVSLAQQAEKEDCSIEDLIITRCDDSDSTLLDLTDHQIEKKLHEWFSYAIKEFDQEIFTLQQLTQHYEGRGVWVSYSASTRKKMGKRFKALVDSGFTEKDYRIAAVGKTITNAMTYKVFED